jgi:hypothetical protein
MQRQGTRGLVVALTLVALGATWTLAAPAGAAKKVKVCGLVTQAQVAAITGNANNGPQDAGSFLGDGSCDFLTDGGPGADVRLVVSSDIKRDAKAHLTFAAKDKFDKTYGSDEPVAGLGKLALYHFDGGSSVAQSALLVVKGKKAVLVVLTGNGVDHDTGLTTTKGLAQAVFKKL